jgi:transposase
MNTVNYIALDVHKKNIVMASSKESGKAEFIGEFPNTDKGVRKLIQKLTSLSMENEIKVCYEAGPCGYALLRILHNYNIACEIVAPSLIPIQVGNKIKTDKRDAKKIARLYRAGELTFITIPDKQKESLRDLIRCRDDIMTDLKRAKQRLNHFLIRHGYHYTGSNWTEGHFKWLNQIELDSNYDSNTFNYYFNEIEFLNLQLKNIDREIEKIAETEEYSTKVKALCAFRGVGILTAMIIISEVIDFNRFSNPRELMSYIGIVPSEYSSGGTIKKGSITKCGNKRVRRALVEAAHHYRHKPIISVKMGVS